jgi:hypothetical protein
MEGSLQGREELLLEHTRNLVQNSYDELGDRQIISSIYDYYLLLEKLNSDKSSISSDELLKLQRLHKLFYNADFDLNEPFKTGTSSTLILDLFKRNFSKIEKLIQETDNTRADILKSLVPLMKVNYYSDKKKKDIVNRYLNEILIPLINSNTQSAIKADKLDETTTSTGVATSGTTASSFLSKVKEAAEAQKESKRGEEMEGAAVQPPATVTTTEDTTGKPKEPSTASSEEELKKFREIAQAKALKDNESKGNNVGIGSTGAPGLLTGLIKTGLSQGEIDKKKTEGTFSETTPENQKELFESFFGILNYLANIGSIFDLYTIVFGEDFENNYFTLEEKSKSKIFKEPGKIKVKLASLNRTKTDNFIVIVQEYMYKVVKEVFDYTKDGLALQKLIASIKEQTAEDKLMLIETIQLKSHKLNLNKLFMKLFEYLEYYFFLFYFYSNIPDFYIEKNPEIIMKLTEDYDFINKYFMQLFEYKNPNSQIPQDVEKKISDIIENQLPTKLENIKKAIIDDLLGKIDENHLSSLIKEDTLLPILEITEIPTGSDSRQRGGAEGKLMIIKGGLNEEIKPFNNYISDYLTRIDDLIALYQKFKFYVDYKRETQLFESAEKEELTIILKKLEKLLNELKKITEEKQSEKQLKQNDVYHRFFLECYAQICALFKLLYEKFNDGEKKELLDLIDTAQGITEDLEVLYQSTITNYNVEEDRLTKETKKIIEDLFQFENKIYEIKKTLKINSVEQKSVEKIAEVIQNLNKKQKDLNTKIETIKEKIEKGKKEEEEGKEEGKKEGREKKEEDKRKGRVSLRAASLALGAAHEADDFLQDRRAEIIKGGGKYQTSIIKGGFPINETDIYVLAYKYISETSLILQIISYTTLEIIYKITAGSIYNELHYKKEYIGKNNDIIIKTIIDFIEKKLKPLTTKIDSFIDAITPKFDDSHAISFLYEYELKEIIKNFKWVIMERFMAFLIDLFVIFASIRNVKNTIERAQGQNLSTYYNNFRIFLSFLIRYYFISNFKLFYYYNIATINKGNDINDRISMGAIQKILEDYVYHILNDSLNVVIYPHYYYKDKDLFVKNRDNQAPSSPSSITHQRISDVKDSIQTTRLLPIFNKLNEIKDTLKTPPTETVTRIAISSNEVNFAPFSIYGGGKNGIELAEVFKIFYNFTSSSNNIYSIFFIINCYYKYSKDEDKDNLIKKLKDPNLSLDDLKEHFMKIFEKTKEIFKDYIKTFLKCDSFIKNYYSTATELIQYLYISFIYDVYKSIKEENINFSLIINKTKIISHKSYEKVRDELKVFFREKQYIFFKDIMPKEVQINESLKEDIRTFMKFIYNYTDEENNITFTYINNINDLFSFITYLFLTLNIPVIKLRINQKNYEIDNIKIHPYSSCSATIHLPIRIHLNETEIELMDRLLTSYKHHDLFKVLANEFYYLDLNLKIKGDYKFCINQEIMSLIKPENYDNNLINFSFYEYLPLSSYKSLKLLRINFNKLSFAINYSILLAGSIFTEITTYNYLSLIYLYCYLLKNKHSLPFVSFLSYIKDCILVMKNKLKLELILQKFMDLVINFKKNPFINKMKINEIDMNFIVEVFESKKTSFDLTDNLHNSLNHFVKSIVVPSINIDKRENRDELIKLMYIYLLPVVEQLTIKGVNTIAIQHDILTIKAMDLLSRLGPVSVKKMGGGIEDLQFPKIVPVKNLPELPRDPSRDPSRTQAEPQRDLLQQQLEMSENRTRVSTDPSIDMQAIIKKLQIIGVIKDQIEGMNIEEIEEKYYKKLLDLATVISITDSSNDNEGRIVVFETNKIQEQVNTVIDNDRKANQKNDEDDKNKDKRADIYSKDQKRKVSPGTIAKIDNILINIDKNLSKIRDELETYGIKIQQSSSSNTLGNSIRDAAKTAEEYISGSTERAKIEKIKENIKILEATIKSLEAYKNSDNQELRALLKDFKIIIDQKEELNLLAEPKTIIDDFKDFVGGMEKFLEIYVKILKELSNIYISLKENIKNTRKSLGYDISEDRNRGYGYPGFYN